MGDAHTRREGGEERESASWRKMCASPRQTNSQVSSRGSTTDRRIEKNVFYSSGCRQSSVSVDDKQTNSLM